MHLLFPATLILSAVLLFSAQPLMARLILPRLGGASAVWNTSVMFFQFALLAAYLYAHLSATRLRLRAQVIVHLTLLAAGLLALPLGLQGDVLDAAQRPVQAVVLMLASSVGLPILAVAASAPLFQRWLSLTSHRSAADPFFLYAASNAGSLVALLSYPILVEPVLSLTAQRGAWSSGYLLLMGASGACGLAAWRMRRTDPTGDPAADGASEPAGRIPLSRRWRWVALAFAPVTMMLGVTTHVTTDIAAVPLLWVVPLAIYLCTYIAAFAQRRLISTRLTGWLVPVAVVPALGLALTGTLVPLEAALIVHVAAFSIAAYACHARLYDDRPAAASLTEFYLWIAAGGLLGGVFSSVAAPVLFVRPLEYPLALALSVALSARPWGRPRDRRLSHLPTAGIPIVTGTMALMVPLLVPPARRDPSTALLLAVAIPLVISLLWVRRPTRLALALAGLAIAVGGLRPAGSGDLVHQERSFFGTLRVSERGGVRVFVHGTTSHGAQAVDEQHRCEPLTYYTRRGPVGSVLDSLTGRRANARIGVVGLGIGTLASYSQAGQRWTFFEVDPAVDRIARDPALFTYLSACAPAAAVVVGDGRVALGSQPDGAFDLLVLDAFSSDAVPVHLLTREALHLYQRTLAEDGLLAFNITNRHLDLAPPLGRLARDAGLWALVARDRLVSAEEARAAKSASDWLVMARQLRDFGALADDRRWVDAPVSTGPVWTDDYSNVIGALRILKWRPELGR